MDGAVNQFRKVLPKYPHSNSQQQQSSANMRLLLNSTIKAKRTSSNRKTDEKQNKTIIKANTTFNIFRHTEKKTAVPNTNGVFQAESN